MNEIMTNPKTSARPGLVFSLLLVLLVNTFSASANDFYHRAFLQIERQVSQLLLPTTTETVYSSLSTNTTFNPPPCVGGSGVVGGVTFQDFNLNGDNDQVGNIGGIEVAIYRCDSDGNSELVATTTSDSDGTYSFSGLMDGETYRVEFRIPESMSFLSHGSGAGDAGTNIQFVTAPTCEVNAGFLNPADYCEEDPLIAAACYVNGDPLAANSGSADEEAIVAFRYNATGNDEKIKLATAEEVGSVYGMGYEKTAKRIYASAFIKRHVGLGPLGLGGIYQIDFSTGDPVVTPFVDVTNIGINVGDFPTNAERELSANPAIPNNDPQAYDAVGKWGIGGITVSDDEKMLWLVNIAQGTLHSILIDSDNNPATAPTAGNVQTFNLPTAGCVGGTFRPFAINYHQDAVYIGGVCDAAMSQERSDLEAVIYRLQNGNFTEVTRFDLDYDKGYTTFTNSCEDFPGWYPWRADLPPACSTNEIFRVYPTPILTDMVFDTDNSLILGFTDRMGHQIGFKNYPLEGTQPLLQTVSGGDILRLYNNNGTYELENNGTAGDFTTAGVGNGEGPGGGEFYNRDVFEGPIDNLTDPQPHTETAQGGLAFVPGSGEVVTTALDPYSTQFNSGGVNWLNNQTGEERNPGFLLYRSSNSNISTFSKANGLGDIISMCNLAPVEISSRVWTDTNNNGIQDPCEPSIIGVNVSLYAADGTLLATTVTNSRGEVVFNENTPNLAGILQPNTPYYIVVGTNGDYDPATGNLRGEGFLTTPDQGDNDAIDSDGQLANGGIGNGAFTGLPYAEITTGSNGSVNHDTDFGFGTEAPEPVKVSGVAFDDANENGIRDAGEMLLTGIMVTLFDAAGNEVATVTTDENGMYMFSILAGGDYYIQFATNPNLNGDDYTLTDQDRGSDDIDSDPDPTTGRTAIFNVDIMTGGAITNVDAGYIRNEMEDASIGDFVFLDCNNNGIQDADEIGIEKVDVVLINLADNSETPTVTDANGFYQFANLAAGDYQIRFVLPADGLTFSPANQGDDALDSDANATGLTGTIILAESEQNTSVDAGISDLTPPTFNPPLPDPELNFSCADGTIPDPITLTATDNFDQNVEVFFATSSDGGGAGCINNNIIRTWTATDRCGNSVSFTQTVSLNDDEAPVFNESLPQDMTITDCSAGGVPAAATLTAIDNCDNDVEVIFTEETIQNDTACIGTVIVRTWTATDDCGNNISHEQRIRFNDTSAPTFNENLPQDETGVCFTGDFGTPPVLTASDDCDNNVDVIFAEEAVGGGCNDTRLVRTWTAVDDCGNTTSHQQTITYSDNVHPIFDEPLPQDMIVNCLDGDGIDTPIVTATDNCDNEVEVTLEIINLGDDCANAQIIRVWTATDDCGNFIKHEQTITFSDTEAPVFNEPLPQDMMGVCFTGDFGDAPMLTATDNCDNEVEVILTEEAVGGGCNDTRLVRTWTATDECGNTISHEQTITFSDNEHPVFNENLPQDMTITDCSSGGVPTAPTLTATDNCDTEVEVIFTEETIQNDTACVSTVIVRTWNAIDDCGNSTTHEQRIRFNDTSAPTFNEPLPQDQTGICFTGDFGMPPLLTASDDCDNNVDVIFAEEAVGGGCNDTRLVRTWTAVDDCGNTVTHQQTITFSDNENPTFVGTLPQDITTEDCNGNFANPPTLTATDNCDNNVEVIFTETPLGDGCAGGGLRRTWVATDDCGNTISHQQMITFIDNTAPFFTSPLPQDINAGEACGVADISNPPTLLAEDNCDNDVLVTFAQNFVDGNNDGCAGGILLRVWTAMDDCGNSISHEQRIMFGDNQPPRFIGVLPPNMSGAECADVSLDNPPVLTATDNCDINVEVIFTQEITEGDITSCAGGTLVRTWTAVDDCGNSITHNQVVSFSDDTAPEITGVPEDVTVECDDIPGVPIVKAVDDCGGEVTLDFQETQTTGCPYTITRTWKATDECGNMDVATQVITVTDTIPPLVFYNNPFLINLQDNDTLRVSCDRVPVLTELDIRVIDNCDADPEIEFVDFIVNETDCEDEGFLAYMYCGWIVTDECGNRAVLNIHIIVEDNVAPELTGVPADITLDVNGSLPDIPTVTATDNCDIDVPVRFNQEIVNTDCGYIIRRTWTAEDDCGNRAVGTQIITVNNNCECPLPLVNNQQITDADCGAENGSASFAINGNPADYVIQWTPNIGVANDDNTTRTNLPPGFYNVKITYPLSQNCVFDQTFEIRGESPSNPNADFTNVTCPNGNDGSITSRDGRTYDVSFNGTIIGQTPLNALAAGTYVLSIGNQTGCAATASVTITQPDPINISIEQQNVSCDGNDGAISLTTTGGNGGYTYQWTPQITTNSFATGLVAGSYQIIVSDSENCSQTVNVEIENECNVECDLTLTANNTDASCGQENGSISVTVSGNSNSGNITYQWQPNVSNGASANNLAAGTYTITAIDNGSQCTAKTTITISQSNNPLLPEVTTINLKCAGVCTGQILPVDDRMYAISQNGTPLGIAPATNLCAGTYTVSYTDDNGCSASTEVTLTEPAPFTASVTIIPDTCGRGVGQLIINASGGVEPYNFLVNGEQIDGNILTGLTAGDYSIWLMDANSCGNEPGNQIVGNVDINCEEEVECNLTLSAMTFPETCIGNDGSIVARVEGENSGDLTYNWTPALGNGSSVNTLMAGTYGVTVTDNQTGCTASMDVIVESETDVPTPLVTLTDADCAFVCTGGIASQDGRVYEIYDRGSLIGTTPLTNLCEGDYTVVYIENDCRAEIAVTINEPTQLIANVTTINADCEENNGSITINAQGGTPPYVYQIDGETLTSNEINNLAVGTYNLAVTDANGCTTEGLTAVISENECETECELTVTNNVINATCDEDNGEITVNTAGIVGNIIYEWNPDVTDGATAQNLAAGTYQITVRDEMTGCVAMTTAVVGTDECETECELVVTNNIINTTCNTDNGEIAINVTGAVGNLIYEWNPDISDGAVAENLAIGTYQITIRDEMTGCVAMTTAVIENVSETPAEPLVEITQPSCGDANGQIVATDDRTYTILQDGNMIGQTPLTNLGAGTYEIQFTNTASCTSTTTVELMTSTSPVIVVANIMPDNCEGGAGSIELAVAGDVNDYTYEWSNDVSTTNIAANLDAGNYWVTVTDVNGCTAEFSNITVERDCNVSCSLEGRATISPAVCGQMNGRIALEVTGATGDLTYTWTPNVSTTATAENLEPGMYNVMVMQAGATCQLEFNIEITEAPLPNGPNVRITFPLCVNEENNTATITSNDEREFQIFAGDNLLGTTPLEGVAAGDYLVVYEDENGCRSELPITVELPDEIEVGVATTPATCENSDGTITLTSTGGIGGADDFTYQWFPDVSNSNVATNLAVGTYDVIVRDSVGCSKIINDIEIIEDCPCTIGLQIADKNDATCAGNDGNITLEVTGATNNDFTIAWSNDLGNNLTINNLAAGAYQATVTNNANGCSANINVVINGEAALTPPSVRLTHVGCAGGNDGMILSEDGRTYAIYDAVTDELQSDPTSLQAGIYRVIYTSVTGCSTERRINLTQPDALSISATNLNAVTCAGNDGSIQLNVTGGEPDYIYQWSDANLSGNFAQNLAVGTYNLTVTDGNGCQIMESYEITEDCACSLSLNVTSNKMATCNEANGSVDVEVIGTTYGELRYDWTGSEATGNSATDLAAGVYSVMVTDLSSGCSASTEVTVNAVDAPAAPLVEIREITCGGDADAEIIAADNRTYEVYKDDEFIGNTPLNNLGTGIYTIIAINDAECSSRLVTEIEPLTAIETSVAAFPAGCNGDNGTIEIQVAGGVPPYQYTWSDDVADGARAEGLTANQYSVTVTDARGCQVTLAAMVGRVCNIPVDTVRIDIAAAVETEYCIPERFLQPTGVLTDGYILANGNANSVLATTFNGRCLTLQPATNFVGAATDTIKVLSCYDSDTEICDETVFIINVDCPSQLMDLDEMNVSGLVGQQCLNIAPNDLLGYTVYVDDEELDLTAAACPYNPLAIYNYNNLNLDGTATYQVNWRVNGQPYEGQANTYFEIADLLNQWDVVENWSNDENENRLIGGAEPFNYGTLMITAPNGAPTLLEAGRHSSQIGTQIDLGAGVESITLENANGCTQEIGLTTEPIAGNFRFVDFTATANEPQTAVPLHWKTLKEDNLARFYIEHSTDSIKFRTLDELVMGKGINNEVNVYDWTHDKPRWGYNYYRIRYVNERGETVRTFTLRVFIQPEDAPDVYVYPNPTVDKVTIDFLQPIEAIGTLQVVNGFGQILKVEEVAAGAIRQQINLQGLPSGVYFIKIDWNSYRKASYRILLTNE